MEEEKPKERLIDKLKRKIKEYVEKAKAEKAILDAEYEKQKEKELKKTGKYKAEQEGKKMRERYKNQGATKTRPPAKTVNSLNDIGLFAGGSTSTLKKDKERNKAFDEMIGKL